MDYLLTYEVGVSLVREASCLEVSTGKRGPVQEEGVLVVRWSTRSTKVIWFGQLPVWGTLENDARAKNC